jgi:predicted RNase H-like nuclease (RuvC/YqgF family)
MATTTMDDPSPEIPASELPVDDATDPQPLPHIDLHDILNLPDGPEKDQKIDEAQSALNVRTRKLQQMWDFYNDKQEEIKLQRERITGLTKTFNTLQSDSDITTELRAEIEMNEEYFEELQVKVRDLRIEKERIIQAYMEKKREVKLRDTTVETLFAMRRFKDKEIEALKGRVSELEDIISGMKVARDKEERGRDSKRMKTEF